MAGQGLPEKYFWSQATILWKSFFDLLWSKHAFLYAFLEVARIGAITIVNINCCFSFHYYWSFWVYLSFSKNIEVPFNLERTNEVVFHLKRSDVDFHLQNKMRLSSVFSSSLVKIRLHREIQLPRLPESAWKCNHSIVVVVFFYK